MERRNRLWLLDRAGLGASIGTGSVLAAGAESLAMLGLAGLIGATMALGIAYAFRLYELRRGRP